MKNEKNEPVKTIKTMETIRIPIRSHSRSPSTPYTKKESSYIHPEVAVTSCPPLDQHWSTVATCSNCGKIGHLFYQCKLPITSYGIILFRVHHNVNQYLMIRRKDSFGYIDFIRGKYSLSNIFQINKCIDEMSCAEKGRILTTSFGNLWKGLWGVNSTPLYRSEESSSSKKFEALRAGIRVNNTIITLENIVHTSTTRWTDQEWEFPKGRRNYKENDVECALREFEEETGVSSSNIQLIDNIIPYEEYFIGSNFKAYKHKFYLAYTNVQCSDMSSFQKTEVSKMQWMDIDTCMQYIRPYNVEKKTILCNIDKMLHKYSFYS